MTGAPGPTSLVPRTGLLLVNEEDTVRLAGGRDVREIVAREGKGPGLRCTGPGERPERRRDKDLVASDQLLDAGQDVAPSTARDPSPWFPLDEVLGRSLDPPACRCRSSAQGAGRSGDQLVGAAAADIESRPADREDIVPLASSKTSAVAADERVVAVASGAVGSPGSRWTSGRLILARPRRSGHRRRKSTSRRSGSAGGRTCKRPVHGDLSPACPPRRRSRGRRCPTSSPSSPLHSRGCPAVVTVNGLVRTE